MKTLCKYSIAVVLSAIVLCGVAFAEVSTEPVQGVIVTQDAPAAVVSTEQMKRNEALLPARAAEKRIRPVMRRKGNGVSTIPPISDQLKPEIQSPVPQPSPQSSPHSSVYAPSLLASFTGMDLNGNTSQAIPPDTMGAAGPTYLMSILNGGVAYYNKTTGAMTSHITDTAFWSSLGTGSGQPADGVFDPKVIYDQYLGRFIAVELSQGSSSNNSYILVGISSTSDPNGTWTLHAIRADLDNGTVQTSNWADFPGVGMDSANLYVSVNMFDNSGSFHYVKIYSIPKTQLQSTASTITYTQFVNNNNIDFTLQPCAAFGSGQQIYFAGEDYTGGGNHNETDSPVRQTEASAASSYLKLFTVTNNTWTPLGDILVSSYPALDNLPDAPQPGSTQKIATNDTRILNAVCRGGYVWATHTVTNASGAKTEVSWYQINPASASLTLASAGSPVQEGRVSDTSMFYYFPSIAVNGNGDAALGFSGSSTTTYAGGYYTARLSAATTGTMQTVGRLVAGAAPYYITYSGTSNRWGDYSATTVDPSDDLTFWTIQEYAKGATNWGTWWGSFTATASTAQNTLTVTMSGTGTGTVTPSTGTLSWSGKTGTASYDNTTQVTLTAAAASGSSFTSWSGCDNTSGSQCTVAMSSSKSVIVTFTATTSAQNTLTVTMSGTGTGTVTPSTGTLSWSGKTGTASYDNTTRVTLTAAAASGSSFTSWSGCDNTAGSQCTVAMSSSKSVTVTFTATTSSRVMGDFLGNGYADILWRNSYNGGLLLWTMVGTAPAGIMGLPPVTDTNWEVAGTADFTSNNYPAILWRNKLYGSNAIWVTTAGVPTSAQSMPSVSDTTWQIVGTGDFDGDGHPDILWRNSSTGANAIWLMTGTSFKSAVSLPAVADTTWQIVGTGDFNSDGSLDIVWRNSSSGNNAVWFMNGTTYASAQSLTAVTDTSWRITAISDYNGDGHPDIVWSNSTTGSVVIWLMNGVTISGTATLPTVTDTTWSIVGPK
ncbi:MAG: VCBS repeat-containing protein [Nitrospirae bacterium]|nr:VCBS repeat-containing protein [Nitrospirota bacterium]